MTGERSGGDPKCWSHPISEILKNTPIAELILLAGTDVCLGQQTPSRRHCASARCFVLLRKHLRFDFKKKKMLLVALDK